MITTPQDSSSLMVQLPYFLLAAAIAAFAVYDMKYKRVPNRGLVCFIPAIVGLAALRYGHRLVDTPLQIICICLAGALLGGGLLFLAAAITHGGIGGGDIKLAFLMGFFLGPFAITGVLFIATILALVYGLLRRRYGVRLFSIPYVPFLAIGCFLLAIFKGV